MSLVYVCISAAHKSLIRHREKPLSLVHLMHVCLKVSVLIVIDSMQCGKLEAQTDNMIQ